MMIKLKSFCGNNGGITLMGCEWCFEQIDWPFGSVNWFLWSLLQNCIQRSVEIDRYCVFGRHEYIKQASELMTYWTSSCVQMEFRLPLQMKTMKKQLPTFIASYHLILPLSRSASRDRKVKNRSRRPLRHGTAFCILWTCVDVELVWGGDLKRVDLDPMAAAGHLVLFGSSSIFWQECFILWISSTPISVVILTIWIDQLSAWLVL